MTGIFHLLYYVDHPTKGNVTFYLEAGVSVTKMSCYSCATVRILIYTGIFMVDLP